jgi:RNA polymerase sigma factor (sigma-70 family)
MKKALYSDQEIIAALKMKENESIRYLYRSCFESVHRLILSNSGKSEDAEDIFQDALVILYRKIKADELKLTCSLKTYLYAVSRNLWKQRLQKADFKIEKINENIEDDCSSLDFGNDLYEEIKYNLYQKHFMKLSEECKKVLKLFLDKIRMEEITKIMGFSSVDYAKTRKYLCKQSLKEKILNDPEYKIYLV